MILTTHGVSHVYKRIHWSWSLWINIQSLFHSIKRLFFQKVCLVQVFKVDTKTSGSRENLLTFLTNRKNAAYREAKIGFIDWEYAFKVMKKKYTDIIYSTNDARELSSVRLPHPGARSCSVLIRIQNRFDCVWCIMVYAINRHLLLEWGTKLEYNFRMD